MKGYLLDTMMCIHFFKGEFKIAEKIQQIGRQHCFISTITLAELAFGAENSSPTHREENRKKLSAFQRLMAHQIIGIEAAIPVFAREKARLRQAGLVLPDFDLLIGSTAVAEDLILATRNMRHFERMEGVQLENWIDAPFPS